ncbi:hypothetical protein [Roseimicrobium sp. ORNL1]|uniref:hypothetical protein n=1 Tax=Roseimicrobium sp. ORNL1 TaxID=2711231 RepID=UPI0013E1E2B4|nr:hypothetical protein [Roseimicrobium sp. ORNL1]QIF02769.1 hypothetical protein G5S37_14985 [Roseimicrobium sp. ORNL1]
MQPLSVEHFTEIIRSMIVALDGFDVAAALRDDTVHALQQLREGDTQFARRSFVRCFMAQVEGVTFVSKQVLKYVSHLKGFTLSAEELMFIDETTPKVKDSGGLGTENAKISTKTNIRFLTELQRKYLGIAAPNWASDEGWSRLLETIIVRDRITHPKDSGRLEVSALEVKNAITAVHWFERLCERSNGEMERLLILWSKGEWNRYSAAEKNSCRSVMEPLLKRHPDLSLDPSFPPSQ